MINEADGFIHQPLFFIVATFIPALKVALASGQQTKLTYPNSKEISYTYNVSGDLLTVGDTVTDFVKQTEYNQNGQIIQMDFNNDLTTAYEYNWNNLRLTKLITGNTSNFTFTDPTYISYDRKDHTAFNAFLESLGVQQ